MESILKEAGSCGRYQVFHLVFTQMPRFVAAWSLVFMTFGGFNPGWRCSDNNIRSHSNDTRNATVFVDTLSYNHTPLSSSVSSIPNTKTYSIIGGENDKSPNTLLVQNHSNSSSRNDSYYSNNYDTSHSNNRAIFETFQNDACDSVHYCKNGIEFNPESYTIVTEFQLVCQRAWFLRIVLLIQSTGVLLGPLVAGQIGEKFGRKISLYGCTAVIMIASLIAIFSTHWVMFAVCYFFIGAAANSIIGLSPVFSMEVLNWKWRGYYNSFPTANLAMFLFSIISYLLRDWASLNIITSCLGFISCIGYIFIPESARWLIANGHVTKAEKSIQKIAKINRKPKIDQTSFKSFEEEMEKENNTRKTYTILDLFRNRHFAILTIKFCLMFLMLSVVYFSVTFGLSSLPGEFYVNAMFANGVEILAVLGIGPLCNSIGRRFTGVLYGSIGTISCISIVIILSSVDEGILRTWVVNIFAYLAKSAAQAMFCVGTTFSSELFPTAIRSVSSGLLRCAVGVGGLIMPFVVPSKNVYSLTVVFAILCVCYLTISAIFTSFPETNRCSLTDTLKIQADKGVNDNINDNIDNDSDEDENDDPDHKENGDFKI